MPHEVAARIDAAREGAYLRGQLDPYPQALCELASLFARYIEACDAAEDATWADVEVEAAFRRRNALEDEVRAVLRMPISARRTSRALTRLGAEREPLADWKRRVLAALPELPERRTWWQRIAHWWSR